MRYLVHGYVYLTRAIVLGSILFLCILGIDKIRKKKRTRARYVLIYLFMVYIIAVLLVTRIINDYGWRFGIGNYNLIPFEDGFDFQNILNLIMLIPFGFFVPFFCKTKRYQRTILSGIFFCVWIELMQLFFVGRLADINDVIMNTLGVFAGCVIHIFVQKSRIRKQQTGSRTGSV
ncbi:MAG: VanZ family protein [Lachnospiraceae bacterium]